MRLFLFSIMTNWLLVTTAESARCGLRATALDSGLHEHLAVNKYNEKSKLYLTEVTAAILKDNQSSCTIGLTYNDEDEINNNTVIEIDDKFELERWFYAKYLHYDSLINIKRFSKHNFAAFGQYTLYFKDDLQRTFYSLYSTNSSKVQVFAEDEFDISLSKEFETCMEYHADFGDSDDLKKYVHCTDNSGLIRVGCNVSAGEEQSLHVDLTELAEDESELDISCVAMNQHHVEHQQGYAISMSVKRLSNNSLGSLGPLAAVTMLLVILLILLKIASKRRRGPRLAKLPLMPVSEENQQIVNWTRRESSNSASSQTDLWPDWVLRSGLMRFRRDALSFDENRPLGSGHYGFVYNGKVRFGTASFDVAVKQARDELCASQDELLGEAHKLSMVCDHVNVVNLKGVALEFVGLNKKYSLILTLYTSGNLESHLRRSEIQICGGKLKQWAHQIANGMCFLAEKGIVHMDLATRNVLLTHPEELAKISDFGLSRFVAEEDCQANFDDKALPIQWLPPELWLSNVKPSLVSSLSPSLKSSLLFRSRLNSSIDVWSYGVMLWELFTRGKKPYDQELKQNANQHPQDSPLDRLARFLLSGQRLQSPFVENPCPESAQLYSIMRRCWSLEPRSRPTFLELREAFDDLLEMENREEQLKFEEEEKKRYRKLNHVDNKEYLEILQNGVHYFAQ